MLVAPTTGTLSTMRNVSFAIKGNQTMAENDLIKLYLTDELDQIPSSVGALMLSRSTG